MKSLLLFLSVGLCANLFATIRTVNNNAGSVAQYTTIQPAINASVSGDTIYIHGSPNQYTGFTITDKRLVLIGPGWSPMQNFMPYPATISESYINGSGSSNTEIQGLHIAGNLYINSASHPAGLRFLRNHLFFVSIGTGTLTYDGYVFEGNWFDNGALSVSASCFFKNFIIRNNMFYCNNANLSVAGFYNSISVIIDHNLFYGPSSGTTPVFGGNCRNLLLTNNIFVHRSAIGNIASSVFQKNITFHTGTTNPWDTSGNSGSGNIANQDPQMADQTAVNNGNNNPLLNFTIAAGPANNTGTDGKDLGLLYDPTGSLNWTNSRMSRLPFVYSMNISNPNIAAGGTLNVQVEARKNN